MREARKAVRGSAYLEQLEQRWLLSGSSTDLLAPQTPLLVDANTITSIVASALKSAPPDDPIYLKYGTITGDVTTRGFVGDIQLTSFQWGVGRGISSPVGAGGERETSPPTVSDVVVTKQFDSSSVPLIQEAFIGQGQDAEIDFVNLDAKGDAQVYLKIELTDALIDSDSLNSGGAAPSEALSLNFTKINVQASDAATGKTTSFEWDLEKQPGNTVVASGVAQAQAAAAAAAAATPALVNPRDGRGGDPIYMKYGDIKGDVTDTGFVGAAKLASFQWRVSRTINTVQTGQRSVSPPVVDEVGIGKTFDSSSVPLIAQAFGGIPSHVDIDFTNPVKGIQKSYLSIDLENTLISSYSMSSGGGLPSESLSLNYTKISFASGANAFKYDLTAQPAQGLTTGGAAQALGARAATHAAAPAALSPSTGDGSGGGDPIFMKYGDINGDVTSKGFLGTSKLTTFGWGVSRSISLDPAGGRSIGTPSLSEATVTKNFDSASIPLIQEAFGTTPAHVDVDFADLVRNQYKPYLRLDLDGTLVSGYSMSSSGESPSESLSLNFTKMTITAGSQVATFDAEKAANTITIPGAAASTATAASSGSSAFAPAPSAGDDGDPLFLKYGNIAGEVTAKGYTGNIQLNSLQWGVGRFISLDPAGGRDISAPSVSEITITKTLDSSSIPLMQEALSGTPASAEADFVNAKFRPYLKLKLDGALISGYSMSSGGDTPSESLSLNFTKITLSASGQSFTVDLTKQANTIVAGGAAALASASSSAAASASASASGGGSGDPIFMKYGDIKGDVTAAGYAGDIQLNSFQWGFGREIGSPDSAGGRFVSQPFVSEVVVTKNFDSSSIPLIQEVLGGSPKHVETDFATAKLKTYLQVQLENTLVSGWSISSGGSLPTESLSLNFTKISFASLNNKGKATQSFVLDLVKLAPPPNPIVSNVTAPAAAASAAPSAINNATSGADAGDPIYMKYGDIKGDVTTKGAEGFSQLNSFQWGIGRGIGAPDATGARDISAPSISEVVVTKAFDSSSVPLIQEAFQGEPQTVMIDFANLVKGSLQNYLTIELDNTLLSGYSASSGGDRPSESLSLNFTKITLTANIGGQKQTFKYDLAAAGNT